MLRHFALLTLVLGLFAAPAAMAQDAPPPVCDAGTLNGRYLVSASGTYYDGQFYLYRLALAGAYTFDGNGAFTGADTLSNDGEVVRRTVKGTYSLKEDCSGTLVITGSDRITLNFDIFVNSAKGLLMIGTDPLTIISGKADK